MRDYATRLGLGYIVQFEGASNQVDMNFDCAHVFIHQPELETFGFVLAETNARFTPIVAVNVGDIPEVLAGSQTSILADYDSVQDVADAIARLVNDPDFAALYGWTGAQQATNQ
jgi:D-inositol-3-phosphate glycosyltransferase